jgi:hypothetical protein
MELPVRTVSACPDCGVPMRSFGAARLPHYDLEAGGLVRSSWEMELWMDVCPACGLNQITYAPNAGRAPAEPTTAGS